MPNPLETVTNALGGLFKSFSKKSSSAVGIDIGSSSITLTQLRKERGTAVLETYGELALGPYGDLEIGQATNVAPERVSEALKDLLREANTTTKVCGVSIPFSSSLISLLTFPNNKDHKELEKMIPIEARKYIPVPISEVQLDWFIIPESEAKYFAGGKEEAKNKTHVLLVAIHNEALSRYRDILGATDLKPSFFEIEIFSAVRSVIDRSLNPVVVLDIGAAAAKLYMVEYGIVKASHIINKGSQDITLALSRSSGMSFKKAEELKRTVGLILPGAAAQGNSNNAATPSSESETVARASELTMEYIFNETKRMMLSYQKKYNKSIEKVILIGGGATIKGILPLAAKHFDVPVEKGNPFDKVETPAFLDGVLTEAGPSFAVSVGLALRKLQERS